MKKNIFKGAKFGDKFLTRDGHIAIYQRYNDSEGCNKLFLENDYISCTPDGIYIPEFYPDVHCSDIVSRYTVDEDKLDLLSSTYAFTSGFATTRKIKEAYKAGYHKAIEE